MQKASKTTETSKGARPGARRPLTAEERALSALVRRELRRAGRPLRGDELARVLGRRCTTRFREKLGMLWLAGRVIQTSEGFALPGPGNGSASGPG